MITWSLSLNRFPHKDKKYEDLEDRVVVSYRASHCAS